MERSERLESFAQASTDHEPRAERVENLPLYERLLDDFTPAERQRLRFVRELYERGRLTEFPRHSRD